MQTRIFHIIFSIIVLCPMISKAQDSISNVDSIKINKHIFLKALALDCVYYPSVMLILQNTLYKDQEIVPFYFVNDNKGYLQLDKFSHSFGAYVESCIGYKCLLNAGLSKKNALIYGGTLGLVIQTPKEIMDGIHYGWGFSWGDMAANALGSGLVVGQELLFNDQLIKYKLSYWKPKPNSDIELKLNDYNFQTYWLSIPIDKLVPHKHIPSWLNISLGYGASGLYGQYENEKVNPDDTQRYRKYLLSLDIDWTKIKTKSKFLKFVFQGINFVKIPFPTLEYNSMGKLKGYWLYY